MTVKEAVSCGKDDVYFKYEILKVARFVKNCGRFQTLMQTRELFVEINYTIWTNENLVEN